MAEGGIPLEDLDRSNAYEDINTLKDLEDIFNDSTYDTVKLDDFRLKQSDKTNIKEITERLKTDITNENIHKLKTLIQSNYNVDINTIDVTLQTDLRKRILSKGGELYLRTIGSKVIKEVQFGKHKYKAIKITNSNGKKLNSLETMKAYGMSMKDPYYELIKGEYNKQETNIDIKDDLGNVIGNIEIQTKNDKQIESTETLRKSIASAHEDIITSTPIPKQRYIIEDIPRQLDSSKELGNIITEEDRNRIVSYLDFIQKNYDKKIQLLNDIEYNKKLINKAEKQLLTETNEDVKNQLRKVISDSEANIQSSKQMLDQILAYNERQYEDINMRLKSKFTLKEKLSYIFRKYGLTITAITLALGLVIDTIITSVRGASTPSSSGNNNVNDKIKQSLKNFSNWLLQMSKKALDNLPAIIGSIISFLLKATASIVGFLAEHIILFVIALAFALYEALKLGYNDIRRRRNN